MSTKIEIFENKEFGQIRTLTIDNQIWFVGRDVAIALGYVKPQNALTTHVDKEDRTTALVKGTGSNYKSKTVIINEAGIYALILGSRLPSAKRFKRWVTAEVLPAIHRTGIYSLKDAKSAVPSLRGQEPELTAGDENVLAYNRGIVLGVLRHELEEDSTLEIYERLSARGKGMVMKLIFGEVRHD